MMFFLVVTFARIVLKPGTPWAVQAAAGVALLLIGVLWLHGYRRQHFLAWLIPVHLVAFTIISYGLDNWVANLGLMYAAIMFVDLYGTWLHVLGNTIAITGGLGLGVFLSQPEVVADYAQQSAGVPLLAFFTATVAASTDRQERTSAREQVLSDAGTRLATQSQPAEVCQVGVDAALRMLIGVPGGWAVASLVGEDGERCAAQAGTPPDELTEHPVALDDMPPEIATAYQQKQGVYRGEEGYSTRKGTQLLIALRTERQRYGTLLVGSEAPLPSEIQPSLEALAAQTTLGLVNAEYAADLRRQAFHDPLTGLANRALLRDRIDLAIERARRGSHTAMLLLDLDGFKQINDVHGHAAGDFLLASIAQRLHAGVRGADTAARLGGDEFAVLLDGMDALDDAMAVAGRLLDSIQEPLRFGDVDIIPRGSIGVATWRDHDVDSLLHDADKAMYAAKSAGKGRVGYVDLTGSITVLPPALDPAFAG